ncbi:MAG: ABC transporter permease, partial [Bacteroidaceae bacterium]|nr:ABC transporter permease [Bacteroidaceae bacterium]
MLLHNLKLATRQLQKYKLQTLLSLVGLAIGFTCFALSSLWWRYETTYDAFHPDADNLYIQVTSYDKWATTHIGTGYYAASLAMGKVPQVEQATVFKHSTTFANEVGVWYCMVDTLFLSVFQPELIAGNYPRMYPDEGSIVLTDKASKKLFGTTDCIGREVKIESRPSNPDYFTGTLWENGTYTVAAVVKNWGKHTLFPFDCLIPFKAGDIANRSGSRAYDFDVHNVMRLHPMSNVDTVSVLVDKAQPVLPLDTRVVRLRDYRTKFANYYMNQVKIEHIRIFALLGLVVVVCAVFNYLSLYTIRIRMRARELALRLVCGSSRGQLLTLLVTEFLLLLCSSCFLGVLFFHMTLLEFKEITHIEEEGTFFFAEMGIYMLAVALGTLPLLVGVTWWVQRQSLNETLHKGMVTVRRNLFRPFSQWLQLAVCMGLVFFTSVIILQLHYLRTTTKAGFIHENRAMYFCYNNPELTENVILYLQSHPDVEKIMRGCNGIENANYSSA